MRSEFEDVFNSLAQLGYAIIFISHEQETVFTREDGSEYNRITPSLSPAKVNAIIENMADIYGYAHLKTFEDGTSKVVLTLRSNDDSVACGSRFRYIDSEIDFTYPALVSAVNNAIDKEAELNGSNFVVDKPNIYKVKQLDFNELMITFQTLVNKLQDVTGASFATTWAPRIVEITDKYLGKGKKVSDMTPAQVEQLDLIVSDLTEQVGLGI